MFTRYTRLALALVFIVVLTYLTILSLRDEVDLPSWARTLKRTDWTQVWHDYEFQFSTLEAYHSKDGEGSAVPSSQDALLPETIIAGDSMTELIEEPKPVLPSLYHGPPSNAYAFPISSDEDACFALVNIQRLINLFNTRNSIFAIVHDEISGPYLDALRMLNVTVWTEPPPHPESKKPEDYKGLLSLLFFKLHQSENMIKRVLILDTAQLIVRSLDSLFGLPPVDLAAPRAYWKSEPTISPSFLLVSPSDRVWDTLRGQIEKATPETKLVEILQRVFKRTVMFLPGSFATQTSHWKEWKMPDWFRPEEIHDINEAGRVTAQQGFERQEKDGNILMLGWAVNRWKQDFALSEENSKSLTSAVEVQEAMESAYPVAESMPDLMLPVQGRRRIKREGEEGDSAGIDKDKLDGSLHDLYRAIQILQFPKGEEPWRQKMKEWFESEKGVHSARLDPYKTWRTAANQVCPKVNQTIDTGDRLTWKMQRLVEEI